MKLQQDESRFGSERRPEVETENVRQVDKATSKLTKA